MKVKVISYLGSDEMFEGRVNEFIKNKKIIDIKFTSIIMPSMNLCHSALIMYEDIDKP